MGNGEPREPAKQAGSLSPARYLCSSPQAALRPCQRLPDAGTGPQQGHVWARRDPNVTPQHTNHGRPGGEHTTGLPHRAASGPLAAWDTPARPLRRAQRVVERTALPRGNQVPAPRSFLWTALPRNEDRATRAHRALSPFPAPGCADACVRLSPHLPPSRHHPHFPEGKTEAERRRVSCSSSPRTAVVQPRPRSARPPSITARQPLHPRHPVSGGGPSLLMNPPNQPLWRPTQRSGTPLPGGRRAQSPRKPKARGEEGC